MVEPLSVMAFMAGFAVFGDKLVDLLKKLGEEKARRNNIASQYFADLSKALSGIVEGLRANQVPRTDGTHLQKLLKSFDQKTINVASLKSASEIKASLKGAVEIANTLDGWLLLNVPSDNREREKMLAVVERITGTCAAIADTLKDDA
jgi:hypothetical protein